MKNRLRFLGTGGDAIVVGKQLRASGGLILTLEGNQFHLDPGPGALVGAKQAAINLREHIGVLISENTLVHANDVNAVIYAMTHGGLDRFGVIICPRTLRRADNPEQGLLFEQSEQCVERVILLDEHQRVGINHVTITPIKHKRPGTGAIGYRFETANNSVAYISDTDYYDGLAEQCDKANVVVAWCRHPSGIEERGVLNADDITALLDKLNPKVCILTGFGVKMLDADPLAQARAIHRSSGIACAAAHDQFELDLDTYAHKTKQKRIGQYGQRS